MKIVSTLLTDFYKIGHINQYPTLTEEVYANLTARKSRIEGINSIVFFGLQYFIKEYLIEHFNNNFFNRPRQEVLDEYERVIKYTLGGIPDYTHIAKLHDLGYLPLEIKALPEGSVVPIGVPSLTIKNTLPEFFWLTNFIESLMSAVIWQPITSATIARQYKLIFNRVLLETIGDTTMADFMGHDFSFRGMGGLESAIISGMGHLTSFKGTDSIPAIIAMEKYYCADIEKELVGTSVSATEHSVMSSGTAIYGEFEVFKKLITEIYPSGIISIVSDTFDLWEVLTNFLPKLKDIVNARYGKVVIRPDSGDPCDIICGKNTYYSGANTGEMTGTEHYIDHPEWKGVFELLYEHFPGPIINGWKTLSEKVGAIYGDSITIKRAEQISQRLMAKGFAPLCLLGIGSYTYQYNTRDTFGMAVKCTAVKNNGKLIEVFKDPITDDGTKKSAKGLLRVDREKSTNKLVLTDQCTPKQESGGLLEVVYRNGRLIRESSLSEIRQRVIDG